MSGTKDMFMDAQERICSDFARDNVEREVAHARLCRMGFDANEADDLLDGAIA